MSFKKLVDGDMSLATQLVNSLAVDNKKNSRRSRNSSILALAKSRSSLSSSSSNNMHTHSNGNNSSLSSIQNVSAVYIQDDAYSWLPAQVIKYYLDDNDNKTTKAQVSIVLPTDWHERTVLSEDSTILELEDMTSKRITRIVSLQDYPQYELPIQNLDSSTSKLLGKRDMADLPHLHEAAILYNLKERHFKQSPYTRVGDIVVAMNPFTWIPDLYSPETRDFYAKALLWTTTEKRDENQNDSDSDDDDDAFSQYTKLGHDPHVYETSCLAYRGLLLNEGNQTILVTGESGAGKTETVKIVMKHLATLRKEDDHAIVARVLESNPVFEAFGNAKTLRNDNSSRFGKFTQLQFLCGSEEKECPLAGSLCHTYLLEKSRVVSHSQGERNYHVFYQLLQAPNDFKKQIWTHLEDTDLENFLYLGDNSEYKLLSDGTDHTEWTHTLEALAVFNFQGDQLTTLLRALCGVLQLGNMLFVEDPASDDMEEGGTVVASKDELEKLQDIFGIDMAKLERAMTTRNLKTGYDIVQVRLSPTVAKDSTDALAKEIYARIFDVLVQSINDYTQGIDDDVDNVDEEGKKEEEEEGGESTKKSSKFGVICLLDIFGFERFQVNRFEQLCINYANEHLQHKYVLDNFRAVQEEYEAEGIELFDFAVVDNSDVLNLLENRLGILISLNEECVRPKGNDESFVYKIKIVNKNHDRIIDKNLHRKTEFGIRHFAGPVTYDATKFVERNTDKLPDDLIECVSQSSNQLISTEFQRILEKAKEPKEPSTPGRRKTTSKTVLQKFRFQLKDLMNNIQDTTTRYIRCIKPNDNMTPKMTDHYTTMRQLECAGLVTAITISRETFPNRLGYDSTRERFDCLMTMHDAKYMDSVTDKEAVEYMLSNLLIQMVEEQAGGTMKVPFACGNTRVYFRAGALEYLETKRLEYYTTRVIIIQNWIRRIYAQERYIRMRKAAILLQGMARGRLELQRYQEKQQAAILLANWVRGCQATALVQNLREHRAVVLIQGIWRTKSRAYQLSRLKKAAVVIQRAVRNREKRVTFSSKLAVAVEEARMDNKLLGLKNEVSQSAATRSKKGMGGRQVNDELLQEVESMFDYLRKEIFNIRGTNSELKAHLRLADEEKREVETHAERAEAAATASRLQVTNLTKTKANLNKVVDDYKQEVSGLKKKIKTVGSERIEAVASVEVGFEKLLEEKCDEIEKLKTTLKKSKKRHDIEILQLQQQAAKTEEGHVTEIMRLKDDLRRTQESHHDYLAKLMDVLETTHQTREQETARIAAELLDVKEEKDSQIHTLQREVETLRRIKKSGPPAIAATIPQLESKTSDVTVVQRELERTSAARQQRSQKFLEVSSRLMEAVSPDNLVTITSVRRARGAKISVVEEEAIRMKKMIRFLGDLYNLEETSQGKVDHDMLKSMDSYMAALEPNTALMKMELSVQQLEAENKRLKEQASGQCPRCEARDKRRMNRNRSNTRGMNSNQSNDSIDA